MKAIVIPDGVLAKAQSISSMAEMMSMEDITEMLAPWVRDSPEDAVRTLVALAAMADKDKHLKQAHAAYTRGIRSEPIVALERQYQRDRQRKNRPYLSVQRAGAEQEEGARGA